MVIIPGGLYSAQVVVGKGNTVTVAVGLALEKAVLSAVGV